MGRIVPDSATPPRTPSDSHERPALVPPRPNPLEPGKNTLPAPGEGTGYSFSGAMTQPAQLPTKLLGQPPPARIDASGRPVPSTATTYPEMPAVRIDIELDSKAGRMPMHEALQTPSQLPPRRRSLISDLGLFEDDEEIVTEVGMRSTDYGSRPPVPSVRDRAVLLRMDGVHAGQVFVVGPGPCTLGRHPTNSVRLDDAGISRFHSQVVAEHEQYWVEDLGSKNGTYVQGRPVQRAAIQDGDWVQLGPRAAFRFSLTDTRQELLLRRLYESSTRDALTGAYNRKHFDERLRTEIAFAARHRAEASLVLFDIDHFKKVNDTFGHQAGDAVLRQVAMLVSRRLRAEDVFARVGGEEFAVILRGIDRAGAARAAERIRTTVATLPVTFDGKPIPITLSAGCASVRCSTERTLEDIVGIADRRLYAAKNTGRNRVVAVG
ncbi:MAG TPA: diguanylate cyclase [Polyangiaceae bacterium]